MTQKQYADMVSIMQISRHFCDQMYRCLANHELIKKGFTLNLCIGDRKLSSGDVELSSIELEQDIQEDEYAWEKNRMEQVKVDTLGRWMVNYDPLAEEGTIPPMVGEIKSTDGYIEFKKEDGKGTGENPGKPYPLDNTWLSVYDYPADVDGGQ